MTIDSWPYEFEVGFNEAKKAFSDPDTTSTSNFGPLFLCFKYRILAHIISTTLIPRKGSLSDITYRDVFVLCCLVKMCKINWATWFSEYMIESAADTHASANLPYGLFIT